MKGTRSLVIEMSISCQSKEVLCLGLSTQGQSTKEDAVCLLARRFKMVGKAGVELKVSAQAPEFTSQLTHGYMTASQEWEERGVTLHICCSSFFFFFLFLLFLLPPLLPHLSISVMMRDLFL